MPNYKGKYFEQVFKGLTSIMADENAPKGDREIQYFSEMPGQGEAPVPLTPVQVQSRLINGKSVIAHSKVIGYVPFGFDAQGELAYGNDLIDDAVTIPDAPQKPGFFWSGFLDLFGYKTEAQQNYEQDLSEREKALEHSAEREALKQHRSELTEIEQKFKSVEKSAPSPAETTIELSNNLNVGAMAKQNEKSAEVERILSENDNGQLAKLKAYHLGHDDDNLDVSKINRENSKKSEKATHPDKAPVSADKAAKLNAGFFKTLIEKNSTLHEIATGSPLDANPPVGDREAFAALTSEEGNISGLREEARQELVENMDNWLKENYDDLKSKLPSDQHEKLKALTGKELVDRLDAMQTAKIARYEASLPLKDWPDHRADKTQQTPYLPYPKETPESQKGQALIDQRRKDAYEVLLNENADPDAVSKAMATVMVCAMLGEKSPEVAEITELTGHELKEMPKDAPRRNRIEQLIHDGAVRNLHIREQFSVEHPEEFDKAVENIRQQPGFRDFLADEKQSTRSRTMLSTRYMQTKLLRNGNSAQFDLAKEEKLTLMTVSKQNMQSKQPVGRNSVENTKQHEEKVLSFQ